MREREKKKEIKSKREKKTLIIIRYCFQIILQCPKVRKHKRQKNTINKKKPLSPRAKCKIGVIRLSCSFSKADACLAAPFIHSRQNGCHRFRTVS